MSRSRHVNTLAAVRQQHGLSQAQAAKLVGCKERQKIARYERGERLPNLPKAATFATAYQVPVEQLFPSVFNQARLVTERNRAKLTRYQPTPYVPSANTTTILALYPGTRNIGMAVFEALPSR